MAEQIKSGKLDIKNIIIKEYQKQKIAYLEKGEKKTLEMTTEPGEDKDIMVEEFKNIGAKDDPFLGRKMTEGQKEERLSAFWKTLPKRAKNKINPERPLYASDVDGSTFSEHMHSWNINQFKPDDSIFHKKYHDEKLAGIHTSFLYIGTKFSIFTWHVEDYNLCSISFLHEGAPKVWYVIAEKDMKAFEELYSKYVADYGDCSKPLSHKTIFLSRDLLEKAPFIVHEVCIVNF